MSQCRIYLLSNIRGLVLLTFYTPEDYQFRVINPAGEALGEQNIYYNASAVEREGRAWIELASREG